MGGYFNRTKPFWWRSLPEVQQGKQCPSTSHLSRPARPEHRPRQDMYHRPEINPLRMGEALTVTDLLADGVTLDDAYAQLPADLRSDCDPALDDHLPWRRPAAVLRELHRTRAGQILAARPCRQCARTLAPELLVPVEHPSDAERTVSLLDALLDLAGGLFELVAGRQPLAEIIDRYVEDRYVDSTQLSSACTMPGCAGSTPRGDARVSAFSISLLGLLASWAYESGLNRDLEPHVTAAWTEVLDELADSPAGCIMTSSELLERASVDPRIVAAETNVPERWAESDWGAMAQLRGESPCLWELSAELGVGWEHVATCVVEVANWLADLVGDGLSD